MDGLLGFILLENISLEILKDASKDISEVFTICDGLLKISNIQYNQKNKSDPIGFIFKRKVVGFAYVILP
jgi:hypothetical protein